MTYGPVDAYADAPRYTDLATVKERLRIPAGNLQYDDRITTAIVSGEFGIDAELGRSFPDVGALEGVAGTWVLGDTSTPPPADGYVIHDGDTTLHIAEVDAYGTHMGTPTGQAFDLNYAYLSQPGGRRLHLALSAPVDSDDYWTFTTTVVSGSWTGPPAFVDAGLVKVSFFEAVAVGVVPVPVVEAATTVAMALYKNQDAPTGTAGSDDFIGELDVAEIVRTVISRSPELRGFRTGAGFGVA